jgi:hypothetical protein
MQCTDYPTTVHHTLQALNLILLTAGEVRELRDTLRDAAGSSSGSTNFKALYSCWSHSAGWFTPESASTRSSSSVSLCLLQTSHRIIKR